MVSLHPAWLHCSRSMNDDNCLFTYSLRSHTLYHSISVKNFLHTRAPIWTTQLVVNGPGDQDTYTGWQRLDSLQDNGGFRLPRGSQDQGCGLRGGVAITMYDPSKTGIMSSKNLTGIRLVFHGEGEIDSSSSVHVWNHGSTASMHGHANSSRHRSSWK